MPDKCSVVGCKGNYRDGPRVHVFSFPKEKELKLKWVEAIKRKDFIPTKYTKVCERHFRKSEIIRKVKETDSVTGKRLTAPLGHLKLLPDAVPSLRILPRIKLSTQNYGQKRHGKTRKKLNSDALKEVLSRSKHISVTSENDMLDGTSVDFPVLASFEWDSEYDGWPRDDSDDSAEKDNDRIDNDETPVGNKTTIVGKDDDQINYDETPIGNEITIAENCNDKIDDETNTGAFFVWEPGSIRLLIELFKSHRDTFKYGYVGKKEEWSKIAQSMLDHGFLVTGDTCELKWHSLFTTYKNCVEKNRTVPHTDNWEHYEQFQDLYWSEITSILNLQTKGMLNVGVQTDPDSVCCTTLECEPVCSSTTISAVPLFADSNDTSINESTQKSNILSLLQLLKEKQQSDDQWQLQMKELMLKNTEVQEQTNKILNRLVEVLVTSVQH